jgi:hypothetical protein
MIAGIALFAASSLVLGLAGFRLLALERLSSVVHLALSGYAAIAAANVMPLTAEFGDTIYFQAACIFFSGSVVLVVASTVLVLTWPTRPLHAAQWRPDDLGRHALLSSLAATIALGLLIGSRGDVFATWSEARFEAGPTTTLGTFLLLIACPGIVSAFLARRFAAGAWLIAVCLMGFVLSGSRATLLAAVGLAGWLMVARANGRWNKLRVILFAAALGVIAHVLMRQIRGLGLGGLLDAYQGGYLLEAFFQADAATDVSGGEAAIPRYLLFAADASAAHDFGRLTSVVRLLLLPVPRVEGWFDKPIDVTYTLWEQALLSGLFAGAAGQATLFESYLTGTLGSLHATVFGEYFLGGGWWALAFSTLVLACVLAGIDWAMGRASRVTALTMTGPMLVGFLFVARGNSVIGLGYFFYLGILVLILRTIVGDLRWRRLLWGGRPSLHPRVGPGALRGR